ALERRHLDLVGCDDAIEHAPDLGGELVARQHGGTRADLGQDARSDELLRRLPARPRVTRASDALLGHGLARLERPPATRALRLDRFDVLEDGELLRQLHDSTSAAIELRDGRRNQRGPLKRAGADGIDGASTPSGSSGVMPSASLRLTSAPGAAASTGMPRLIERLTSREYGRTDENPCGNSFATWSTSMPTFDSSL